MALFLSVFRLALRAMAPSMAARGAITTPIWFAGPRTGRLKPIGGWRLRSDETVEGAARAMLAWKDNAGISWLGVGTHSGLFVQNRAGDVYEITPVDFEDGRADALAAGGYGDGVLWRGHVWHATSGCGHGATCLSMDAGPVGARIWSA